jgi:UDP-N-acetylglucosamine:LPS N-acetylglucosamine transferase
MVKAGAARLVLDAEMSGARLVEEVRRLAGSLEEMSKAARARAKPSAAARAATILEGYISTAAA